ncbi:hypothetical protein [Nonomuraea sp. SYSU D8015]|uniref:hypothetical protein n=1 Tax=Nonomuraea sp. SYSU D8015 TaxID=2593644 RepID=UPI0016613641|nr:hypothetical protein [Nonomuraea sp. SYSU D8015]
MNRPVRIRSVTVSVTIVAVAAIAVVLFDTADQLSPAALLAVAGLIVAAAAGVLYDALRRPQPRPPLSEAYQRGFDSVYPAGGTHRILTDPHIEPGSSPTIQPFLRKT